MRGLSGLAATVLLLGSAMGVSGEAWVSVPDTGRVVAVGSPGALANYDIVSALTSARLDDGPLCVLHPSGAGSAAIADTVQATLSASSDGVRTLALAGPDEGGSSAGADEGRGEAPRRGEFVSQAEASDALNGCGGVVLAGWEAGEFLERLRPTGGASSRLERALRSRWVQGAVLGTVGEAASALGVPAPVAGSSADAMAGGVRTTGTAAPRDTAEGALDIREGLGVVVHGIVDTRPLAEGRWGRLLVAALDHPRYPAGFGVSGGGALVIDGGIGRVVGTPGVVLIDARGARRGAEGRVADVQVALLGSGSRIDLDALAWSAPDDAASVRADGSLLPPPRLVSPFAPWRLGYLMVALSRSPGTVTFSDPRWTLSLRPGEGFRALAAGDATVPLDQAMLRRQGSGSAEAGPRAIPPGFTAGPLQVTLTWSGGGAR